MNTVIAIKLGGSIIEDENNIVLLSENLKILLAEGIKVILVHGGSKAIDQALKIHQVESSFLQGLRMTSLQAMHVIEMVLCGHVNKKLVKKLNVVGIPAIGLSGVDHNLLICKQYHAKYGCVGEIVEVNHEIIKKILEFSLPVIAPVGIDVNGQALNINADYAASAIASVMKVDHLIYLTDQEGIYDSKGHVIPHLSLNKLQNLINKRIVKDGMLTKTKTIQAALQTGVNSVHVLNGKKTQSFLDIFTGKRHDGTLCVLES